MWTTQRQAARAKKEDLLGSDPSCTTARNENSQPTHLAGMPSGVDEENG